MVDCTTGSGKNWRCNGISGQVAGAYDRRLAGVQGGSVRMDCAQHWGWKMNSAGPVIAAAGFIAFTQIFSTYAPVTVSMHIEEIERNQDYVQGHVYGRKIKDCAVVKDSFVGWQKVGNVWRETPFAFIDDPSPNSTRPDGWEIQDFGIWRWYDVLPTSSEVKMTLQHNCKGSLEVTQASFSIADAAFEVVE